MVDSVPLPNDPASRTPTGEIINLAAPQTETETTTPETTTPSTETSETTPVEPKADTKPAAPEAYTPFKLPEGIKLDGEALTKATELFKGLGLSQDAAQSLVDFHTAALKSVAEGPAAAYKEMTDGWREAQKADPEIGPKADAIKQTVGKALATLGDPKLVSDFQEAMNITGVGDHPAFIKVMNAWASRVVEGSPVRAGGPAAVTAPDAKPRSIANALYPNLPG